MFIIKKGQFQESGNAGEEEKGKKKGSEKQR